MEGVKNVAGLVSIIPGPIGAAAGIIGIGGDLIEGNYRAAAADILLTAASAVGAGILAKVGKRVMEAIEQSHHLIPRQVFKEFKEVLPSNYNNDHIDNLMKLPTPFHRNHPSYYRYVNSALATMSKKGPIEMEQMKSLQNQLRSQIQQIQDSGQYERLNTYFQDLGY